MSRSGTRYGGSISIHLLIVIQQEFLFIYFYFLVGWLGFEGGGGVVWLEDSQRWGRGLCAKECGASVDCKYVFDIKTKNHRIITISMTPGICMTAVHHSVFGWNLLPVEQSNSKPLISESLFRL